MVAPAVVESGSGQASVVEGGLQPWEEVLRKRFSPSNIDPQKCLARVFGKGKGGQCGSLAKTRGLCGRCGRDGADPPHGFVNGAIPTTKWKAFGITEEEVTRLQADVRNDASSSAQGAEAR